MREKEDTRKMKKKKKGMKMRKGRAAVKETDWKKRRIGNRRGKKEGETKGRVCVCQCVCVCSLAKPPTVMRQTNELAFCHAGHMCVWLTGTGAS